MALPAGPEQQAQSGLEVPKNFRGFTLNEGEALYLSGTEDTHFCTIFVRNGMVVLRNNETGRESFLTPGSRYILGRNELSPYRINSQHQIEVGAQNDLPADFFDPSVQRAVSRKHFHIIVHNLSPDGQLDLLIKDISRYAPVESAPRYHTEARVGKVPYTDVPPADGNLPIDRIVAPGTEAETLTTPARPIGATPSQFNLRPDDTLLLETKGSQHIARLTVSETGLLVANDSSGQQRSLAAGNTYILDPGTLGPTFFGLASAVISKRQCVVKIGGIDEATGIVSFQLVDPKSRFGTMAKFEIAGFVPADTEKNVLEANSSQTFQLQEGEPITLETLRGSHLFCVYLFNNRVFLHNVVTDQFILMKPGDKLPLGTENAQCNRDLLAGTSRELAGRHGGIVFGGIAADGSATVQVLNGKARTGLQYAEGALRPEQVLPYRERTTLNAGEPCNVPFLRGDGLALLSGFGKEDETGVKLFGRITGDNAGGVVLQGVNGSVPLQPGKTLIGRNHQTQRDFFGPDPDARVISRDHLEADVCILDEGRFNVTLTDLSSGNGTKCILFPGV